MVEGIICSGGGGGEHQLAGKVEKSMWVMEVIGCRKDDRECVGFECRRDVQCQGRCQRYIRMDIEGDDQR